MFAFNEPSHCNTPAMESRHCHSLMELYETIHRIKSTRRKPERLYANDVQTGIQSENDFIRDNRVPLTRIAASAITPTAQFNLNTPVSHTLCKVEGANLNAILTLHPIPTPNPTYKKPKQTTTINHSNHSHHSSDMVDGIVQISHHCQSGFVAR